MDAPWHVQQFFSRIGLMSVAKDTGSCARGGMLEKIDKPTSTPPKTDGRRVRFIKTSLPCFRLRTSDRALAATRLTPLIG